MNVKESIIKKKLARKKLASKMTANDTVELLLHVNSNIAFLKHQQKKQLIDIMAKANSDEPITTRDNINLLEMRGTIRVYLVYNSMNVDTRTKKLFRDDLTDSSFNDL